MTNEEKSAQVAALPNDWVLTQDKMLEPTGPRYVARRENADGSRQYESAVMFEDLLRRIAIRNETLRIERAKTPEKEAQSG